MGREIEFRCWYDNHMHKVNNVDFRHKYIDLYAADTINFEEGILMQYTGLKDKNGVKIFEGDIIHHDNIVDNADYVVEYKEGIYCGVRDNKYRSEEKMYLKLYMVELSDLEVIGNIYEKNLL